jgi:hypothetical protein
MKAFTIEEMENIFEIGRVMQAMFSNDKIEIDDSKDAFNFAVELAIEFEKEHPNTEEYYYDLDEFVTDKILDRFKIED